MTSDYNLDRFLHAQSLVYEDVIAELRAGEKRTHWMWFIFPQIAGLGSSPTAVRYAILSREEAAAYLQHPLLGSRLRECTRFVNAVEGRSIHQIFGYPDDLKFHSSMTLFANATPDNRVFNQALQKYFKGGNGQSHAPTPVTRLVRQFSASPPEKWNQLEPNGNLSH